MFKAAASAILKPTALRDHLTQHGTPLILRSLIPHYPAFNTPDDLRPHVGENTAVDVELAPRGRGYLDPSHQKVTMGFGLFLDAFVMGRIPAQDPSSVPVGYLAQWGLEGKLGELLPPLEVGDIYNRTLWVGPKGSFTPFHRDPNDGVYSQLVGGKVFHLAPPAAGRLLRPNKGWQENTSTMPVSVGCVEEGEGLRRGEREWGDVMREVAEMEGSCVARLGAGDSVLIPAGWWHSAEGESPGVGVNVWFR